MVIVMYTSPCFIIQRNEVSGFAVELCLLRDGLILIGHRRNED